jgi:hypothetical protein
MTLEAFAIVMRKCLEQLSTIDYRLSTLVRDGKIDMLLIDEYQTLYSEYSLRRNAYESLHAIHDLPPITIGTKSGSCPPSLLPDDVKIIGLSDPIGNDIRLELECVSSFNVVSKVVNRAQGLPISFGIS